MFRRESLFLSALLLASLQVDNGAAREVASGIVGMLFSVAEPTGLATALMMISIGMVFGISSSRPDPSERMVGANIDTENRRRGSERSEQPNDIEIVAHELQTALTSIQRLTEVGEMSDPTEIQAHVLRGIRHETESLRALIRDLYAIADAGGDKFAVHPSVCSIRDLLAPIMAFAQSNGGDHQVTLLIEDEANVVADPERIGQVLRNLMSNATKYSPAGREILVRAVRHGRRMVIEVIDQGYGIPSSDFDRIFQPFERGQHHQGHPGMGLGLYISQYLVRLHGSSLHVCTSPEAGTVFSFSLEIGE